MANVAREIEEPILEHSQQNGEGFRLLLPSLGRFLGKNHEEAAYAASHGLPWCESPWCEEERRHATTFARIIERLTGTSPVHDNPNRPKVVTSSEADAVRLVISRESAEWNSSSTYTVMAAHGTGDLHHLLRNLARDEIKHLATSAASAGRRSRAAARTAGREPAFEGSPAGCCEPACSTAFAIIKSGTTVTCWRGGGRRRQPGHVQDSRARQGRHFTTDNPP